MKQIIILYFMMVIGTIQAREAKMTERIPENHPRILLTDARVTELNGLLKTDKNLQTLVANLRIVGESICNQPPVTRVLKGKKRFRLLDTSRKVLSRVLVLGTLHRLYPEEKWGKRLTAELKAVCAFEDWHPEHYLDTAEMSAAVAIGYDWLYNDLSDDDRITVRDGLIKHGLETGLQDMHWVKRANNWNQVCHCGLVLTSLALPPARSSDCETLLQRAKTNHVFGLSAYKPAGVYPEGPGYWGYGTSFTVLMASALDSAIGDDWGVLKSPGFKESFEYFMHVRTPTGKVVNYADCGEKTGSSPWHLYLAQKLGTPGYSSFAMKTLTRDYRVIEGNKDAKNLDRKINHRMGLAVAWYVPEKSKKSSPPLDFFAGGKSEVHLALMRSAWDDKNALFASLKAGELQVGHGHLDNGSFVIESDGVRWAGDLGRDKEIYDRKDCWSTRQDSPRWKFFRANNFGHNTLTIDGQIQRVEGVSPIIATASGHSPFAITDLSAAYAGQATSVKRGIMMPGRQAVLIRDEISGVKKVKSIRWNMMTRAKISISDDGKTATLAQMDKTMTVTLNAPDDARFISMDAKPPKALENENPNNGWSRLVVDFKGNGGKQVISVSFCPGNKPIAKVNSKSLKQWKENKGK